jgi:hypothetical protein
MLAAHDSIRVCITKEELGSKAGAASPSNRVRCVCVCVCVSVTNCTTLDQVVVHSTPFKAVATGLQHIWR